MYQCAETANIPRGRGTSAPNARQASVKRFLSCAFIGEPCPRNAAGIAPDAVTMEPALRCYRSRNRCYPQARTLNRNRRPSVSRGAGGGAGTGRTVLPHGLTEDRAASVCRRGRPARARLSKRHPPTRPLRTLRALAVSPPRSWEQTSHTRQRRADSYNSEVIPRKVFAGLAGGLFAEKWAVPGLNWRPPACRAGALPTELTAPVAQILATPRLP
jgi:hypothetical protein